ncbi:RidA family protein [Rhodobacteraceae bacterium NNCM2]|nr:RidA family protein [Coraliihabitans acroporae]
MTGRVETKLAEMGYDLPEMKAPLAAYVPHVRTGSLLFVSGQVSLGPDGLVTGQLTEADNDGGSELDRAVEAAKLCALNLMAAVKDATGDLDQVSRIVKLTGFVNGTGGFTQHPKVINGCSELLGEAFGPAGKHTRSAVGASCLPFNVMVEVEGIFEIGGDAPASS